MLDNWFYQVGDKARQASAAELRAMRESGGVADSTMVWREGFPAWVPFGQTELGRAAVTPPAFSAPDGRVDPVFGIPVVAHADHPRVPPLAVSDDGWQDTTPHPWRRYVARMLDITLLSAVMGWMLGVTTAAASPELYESLFVHGPLDNPLVDTMLSTLLVIPALAVLIGLFGTSPGKWLMGVRVTGREGQPIGVAAAFGREFNVYLRGLGLGIPLVSLFTLFSGYNHLKTYGVASWDDREPHLVTHRPDGVVQVLLAIAGIAAWVLLMAAIRALK